MAGGSWPSLTEINSYQRDGLSAVDTQFPIHAESRRSLGVHEKEHVRLASPSARIEQARYADDGPLPVCYCRTNRE
jgi:hypothetical protein